MLVLLVSYVIWSQNRLMMSVLLKTYHLQSVIWITYTLTESRVFDEKPKKVFVMNCFFVKGVYYRTKFIISYAIFRTEIFGKMRI